MSQAVVEDADKTEGKDRDLVHGDVGTLGLGDGDDLNKDELGPVEWKDGSFPSVRQTALA